MTRNKITPCQLFFLTLAVDFSGLSLNRAPSAAEAIACFLGAALAASLCICGLRKSHENFGAGLNALLQSRGAGAVFHLLLLLSASSDAALTALAFSERVRPYADFLPRAILCAAPLLLAIWGAVGGLTAIGRTAELAAFLWVPLLLVRLLSFFSQTDGAAWAGGGTILPSVTPLLFLLFRTAVPGDAALSEAMQNGTPHPRARAPFLLFFAVGGAGAAALLALLERASSEGIFAEFVLWTAGMLRLTVDFSVLADSIRSRVGALSKSVFLACFSLSFCLALAAGTDFALGMAAVPPVLLCVAALVRNGIFGKSKMFLRSR